MFFHPIHLITAQKFHQLIQARYAIEMSPQRRPPKPSCVPRNRDNQMRIYRSGGAKHLTTVLWHLRGLSSTTQWVPAGLEPVQSAVKADHSLENSCLAFKKKRAQWHEDLYCYMCHTQLWS